jgi:hypothetical protein
MVCKILSLGNQHTEQNFYKSILKKGYLKMCGLKGIRTPDLLYAIQAL